MTYNSTRLLQLLKICSWSNKSLLEYSGFSELADSMDQKLRVSGADANTYDPDKKYLGKLFNELIKNRESGNQTNRHPRYINKILQFVDFHDWEEFDNCIGTAENYLDLTQIDMNKFQEAIITVVIDDSLVSTAKQQLAYAEKKTDFPIDFHEISATEPHNLFKELEELSEKSQFIIWVITDKWNNHLPKYDESPELRELLGKGQIVPVRMNDKGGNTARKFAFKTRVKPPYGKVGLLVALAAIEHLEDSYSKTDKIKKEVSVDPAKIQTLNNESGTIIVGNPEIKGENVALGNIIQNYNKKD